MANEDHLRILNSAVEAWNEWRQNTLVRPDLDGANLRQRDLSGADLHEAGLMRGDLRHADLRRANLKGAHLVVANLCAADLGGADLSGSNLTGADLLGADLRNANLAQADLGEVNLTRANLTGANLKGATLRDTIFANIDLSEVKGLDAAQHSGPSTVGLDTLYKSQGRIPDKFLRDAGVPEEIIEIARSIASGPPIQWHSCFIGYSTKDEEFARRLHSRMREANMRVWFAPEDLAGGKKLHEQLFGAIQLQDKLLLVLSAHSIQSEWVMTEIRKAREIEKKENRRKLFPIRLVDFDALRAWTCFDADGGKDQAMEVREYFIPDFSNWKDHDAFEEAFKGLQRDLKDRSANTDSNGQVIQELKEQLQEYRCPFCGAPVAERGGDWVGSEHYGLHEIFECGYHALDSCVERPCPSDPRFPHFEHYELEFHPSSAEPEQAWVCIAVPKTEMARKLRLSPGLGSSKHEAERSLRDKYEHSSIKWRPRA